ncbi:PKD domain-containing protein [Flavobacterium sp. ANB]|uniref:PKD domain-containing protein n=1 Tax=unclassified Flavobacterium TaxID=196869 RepID=UPI0012B6BAD9|nr:MULTISPECIES: PKD domain-containing protein [unclassified Flavobacterium]MBF4517230.1 PKD domain-containing protein [Flavobacterium sp. ANB]MTD70607.1 PKD domain-containing protein [Flavobacterium sp. LC2016-13]
MKKIITILMLATVFFSTNSCSKHDDEVVFDCTTQSIFLKTHNSTDTNNPKLMNYSVEYEGSGTLSAVKWTFGDGTTGTGMVVTHTYAVAGTYEAKAEATVKIDGSECTTTLKRTVTVN